MVLIQIKPPYVLFTQEESPTYDNMNFLPPDPLNKQQAERERERWNDFLTLSIVHLEVHHTSVVPNIFSL